MKQKLILLLMYVLAVVNIQAQEDTVKNCPDKSARLSQTPFDIWMVSDWSFSAAIGANYFLGDVATYDNFIVKPNVALSIEKKLSDYLSAKVYFSHGALSGKKSKYSDGSPANLKFDAKITEYSGLLQLDILNLVSGVESRKHSWFLYSGVGIVDFRTKAYNSVTNNTFSSYGYNAKGSPVRTTREVVVPTGVIYKYNVTQALSLNLETSLRIVNSDKVDAVVSNHNKSLFHDVYNTTSVGFTYKFGYKDCDGDGVPNRLDKCPNTPLGISVDAEGCPLDSDGDGIPDYQDECPDLPGTLATNGCPDSDGDGIADKLDECPYEKGLPEFNGCPDTDGDGIPDKDDKCPKEPGSKEMQGCPDTDGDGIADFEDRCPDEAGPIELNGCPDKDGDGIPDIDDKCPDEAGIAQNLGCPEVKKEVLKVFERALTGIQFESGKDVILKSSFQVLDQVADILKNNPTYNLEINGHTDNVGDPQKNLELSNKRAQAVLQYLSAKGVGFDRMVSKGYGDTLPIADNKTAQGKAKNRRVEFKVVFKSLVTEE